MKEITEGILRKVIVKRQAHTHKGDYGRILLIGGFYPYGGAIIMAAMAAVQSGAGLVTVATDPDNIPALHSHLPEAMAFDVADQALLEQQIAVADVLLLGPGTASDDKTKGLLQTILPQLASHQVLILDGGALASFANLGLPKIAASLILTPHQKEFERLSGLAIEEQETGANQVAVNQLPADSLCLLKKQGTEVYQSGSPEVTCLPIGGPYQATGGMGDTLAGMIAGFVGQFPQDSLRDRLEAALYLHSAIARDLSRDRYVVLPTQISQQIPTYMKKYSEFSWGYHEG